MALVIVSFLLVGLWETEAMSVKGVVGRKITINCSHSNAFYNDKYFCKDPCKSEDILITSSETNEDDSDRRYSIHNKGNTFEVTISDLKEDDSGTYWCGIDRIGFDTYNEVVLTVIKEEARDHERNFRISNNTNSLSSVKLVYIGAGLGVVVLALAMVLLIFFRHRNRDINASSGKDQDTVYATPSIQKQHNDHDTTSYSAEEDQETNGSTVSPAPNQHQDTSRDNVYSNITVSSEPEIQPDGLFYSTVSFNEHTDFSTVTPRTATATYSSLKHTSPDESIVYCSV